MAEEDEEADPTAGLTQVPPWVLRIVRDIAETKTTTNQTAKAISEIAVRIDNFITRSEYKERHDELKGEVEALTTTRINPLWDSHNLLLGREQQRDRGEKTWRYIVAVAFALLTAWATLRQLGIIG